MLDTFVNRLRDGERVADEMTRQQLRQAADEIERLRAAVLFFSKHYDGPPDNMLSAEERVLFQLPELLSRDSGGEE